MAYRPEIGQQTNAGAKSKRTLSDAIESKVSKTMAEKASGGMLVQIADTAATKIEGLPGSYGEFDSEVKKFVRYIAPLFQNYEALLNPSVIKVRLALTSVVEGKRYGLPVRLHAKTLLDELNTITGKKQDFPPEVLKELKLAA